MGSFLARRGAVAAVGALAVMSAAACGLIVGEVHGHLTADASLPEEAGLPEDAPVTTDAGLAAEASLEATDVPETGVTLDASAGCNADFDADPTNCGWCGHACGSGGACSGGACSERFVWQVNPSGMAYDQGSLFFTGVNNSDVVAYALGPATSKTIAPAQNAAAHIVARSPYVFWTTADGAIHRVLEDGGALTTVVPAAAASCLAANGSRIYWWAPTSGTAYSVPVDSDGGATPVVEYTANAGASGCVNANDGVLAVLTNGALVQRDLDSGLASTATLPNAADTRYLLLAGANAVAFTTSVDDAGMSTVHVDVVPAGTSTVLEVTAFPWANVLAAAADDAGIYWSPQLVVGSRVDGCSDVRCTGGLRHYSPPAPNATISKMAIDPTYIYFTKGAATEAVYKVPR